MLSRVLDYFIQLRATNRVAAGLARAVAVGAMRQIDPTNPSSWEFSAFSQNGEDGLIDYLLQNLRTQNRYFVEIGVFDGLECNTAWLAIARKFNGVMIEGSAKECRRAAKFYSRVNLGVECISAFVNKNNIERVLQPALYRDADVFSLDIDGNDYHIAQTIMDSGIRPKIFVVEYNSAFGPDDSITIPYRNDFDFTKAHP